VLVRTLVPVLVLLLLLLVSALQDQLLAPISQKQLVLLLLVLVLQAWPRS
jgi:hypothetical protein